MSAMKKSSMSVSLGALVAVASILTFGGPTNGVAAGTISPVTKVLVYAIRSSGRDWEYPAANATATTLNHGGQTIEVVVYVAGLDRSHDAIIKSGTTEFVMQNTQTNLDLGPGGVIRGRYYWFRLSKGIESGILNVYVTSSIDNKKFRKTITIR